MFDKIICIYSCKKDSKSELLLFKTKWFRNELKNKKNLIILFRANNNFKKESELKPGKINHVTLKCEEKYHKLSLKTYEMLKYIKESGLNFKYILKLDSTLIDYKPAGNHDTLNFDNFVKFYKNKIEGDYCGISHAKIDENTYWHYAEKWANRKNILKYLKKDSFLKKYNLPKEYFRGKSYFVSKSFLNKFCTKKHYIG